MQVPRLTLTARPFFATLSAAAQVSADAARWAGAKRSSPSPAAGNYANRVDTRSLLQRRYVLWRAKARDSIGSGAGAGRVASRRHRLITWTP